MMDKQTMVENFIEKYMEVKNKEEKLRFIQKGIEEKADISFHGEITVNGVSFPIQELLEVTPYEAFKHFENELKQFIDVLLKQTQMEKENLLSLIEFKKEDTSPSDEENSLQEEKKIKDIIVDMIQEYDIGDIINPMDIFDKITESFPHDKDGISISDIHEVLREYVDRGEMKITHFVSCLKCDNGYKHYYDKLPRYIACAHCGEEIVNIEIHYRKLF
jgi:hypothetical protein